MRKFFFLCALSIFSHHLCSAQTRAGDNVVIDEAVDHDLYIAGGTVTINAPVRGDLIVAGGTVQVNDTIAQDILVAGGNIYLNGFVGDDIRCAGGVITLSSNVDGDFVVTGGQVHILRNGVVGGGMFSSGGQVTMDGIVKGDVKDASGAFTLNGNIGKELECRSEKIVINGKVGGDASLAADRIEVGREAGFDGNVRYWNPVGSVNFQNSLHKGKATYDAGLETQDGKWHYLGFASFLMVLWYLGTALVMMSLIQYLFSTTFQRAANTVRNESVKSLGAGFTFFLGVPIAIVVICMTVIGIPIGVLALAVYVTTIVLATVIVALLISNWINNTYYQSSWGNGRIVVAAFGIFIFLKLASLTPVVGPMIMLLLAAMGFGGILLNVRWKRRARGLALT